MSPDFFIIASIFGWGFGSFFYKYANTTLHPIMVSSIALGMYIVLMPFLWVFVKFDHVITTAGIVYTLIGSLFMCIGTLGFSYALRSGGAVGQTTILCALYPALTLTLSMVFLKEDLTVKKGIGIVLALVSFAILSLK
jgi:drug/metabolite transporter (DMT)-like permease